MFGRIFELLAERECDEPEVSKEIAFKTWQNMICVYSFIPSQMCCDAALMVLGLAKQKNDDKDFIIYAPPFHNDFWYKEE